MDGMSDSTKKPEIDSAKAEAFAGRLLKALNDGALCLMIAVGHRVGLFNAMRRLTPSTSDEIARHSGLKERYVREWLGAMVTGRVIDVDPESNRYFLPPEHAAFLTRGSERIISRCSPNTSACSAASSTTSSNASKMVAGYLMQSFRDFTT